MAMVSYVSMCVMVKSSVDLNTSDLGHVLNIDR
jgi:hypothetical protein